MRHLTGYVAGMAGLQFKLFALFAYVGAIIWASLLLTLGYFFGSRWQQIVDAVDNNVTAIIIVAIVLIILYIVWRMRKNTN